MSLLGQSLLVVLGVLTVLLPIATVLLWSRLRGPRALRIAARAGLLVTSQLVAVLLVAAAANDYGYFYGSWTGLWRGVDQMVTGVSTTGPVVITGAARPGTDPPPGGIRVVADRAFSTPSEWATRGRLETVLIHGPITQIRTMAHVYLPPQYFQRRYAHSTFPAAEVLTGYPGTNMQQVRKLQYQQVLLRELHHHRARPMVLVMMRSAVVFPRDTECTDVPGGPQAETFLAQDVPWAMTHSYRVQPAGWAAIGDSTGGYCAAKITMMNPYTFHVAVSFSGYFTPISDSTTGSLWGGSKVLRNLNSPLWRLQHMPAPPVSMLLLSSHDEGGPLGITNTQRFAAAARPPLQVSTIIEAHGGHNFGTWRPEIPRALAWVSARLPQAVPH
ncbi:MAG: alpha/beta hydrolase [Oryzihumus sp.]